MSEGYEQKMDLQMQMLAWHCMNIMNVHLDKRDKVTVDQLLGKNQPMSREDKETQFTKLIHLMDRKGA